VTRRPGSGRGAVLDDVGELLLRLQASVYFRDARL
jgi:hypothetical protein